MLSIHSNHTGTPVLTPSPTPSWNWTDLPPSPYERASLSPTLSLSFLDRNIENITSYHDCIGTNINGTLATEARSALKAPRTAARQVSERLNHQFSKLNWRVVRNVLSDWAEEASFELSAQVNRAFEGHDACEMGYKVVDLIPSFTMPTMRQLGRKFDSISDVLQTMLERTPLETKFEDERLQGMQWIFAIKMGEKVRKSLVKEGICKEWQVMPSRENLQWQDRLNQALVSVLEMLHPKPAAYADPQTQLFQLNQEEFSFAQLMEFKPVWVADQDRKVWKLRIDTLFMQMEECDGEFLDTPLYLQTGFELPENEGSLTINDYCRGTHTVEGEWEMLA
jgi:hypothetical protein